MVSKAMPRRTGHRLGGYNICRRNRPPASERYARHGVPHRALLTSGVTIWGLNAQNQWPERAVETLSNSLTLAPLVQNACCAARLVTQPRMLTQRGVGASTLRVFLLTNLRILL